MAKSLRQKRIYAARLTAFQDARVPAFMKAIRSEKNRYIDAQLSFYRRYGFLSAEQELVHTSYLEIIYRKNARRIMIGVAKIALDALPELKSRVGREVKRTSIESALGSWYANYAGSKIKKIAKTTTSDLRRLMYAAFQSEKPENEVIKAGLRAKGLSAFRAETIARTETAIASSFASALTVRDMAQDTGLTLFKTWLAVNDERTREDHSIYDGEMISGDNKFIVGGEA